MEKKSKKLCPQCLNRVDVLWNNKGASICPDCYHKEYGRKKYHKLNDQNKPRPEPTINDLKRKFEKKGWG